MPFKNSIPGETLECGGDDGGVGRGEAVQDDRPEGVQADQMVCIVRWDGGAFEEEVEQVEPELLLGRVVVDPHCFKMRIRIQHFFLIADPRIQFSIQGF